MPQSILFVDEEPLVRKALQRILRNVPAQWLLHFAASPAEAARILVQTHIDILVTETVFTGASGLKLLKSVRRNQPHVVRIILSGYADRDSIMQSVDIAHQYLSKPCDIDALLSTINRAFRVKDLLDQDDLQRVVSRIDALPSLPSLYTALVAELSSEHASMQKVGDIIARDLGLTARVLKLANASCFGLRQRVTNPAKAAALLGMDLIQALVLAHGAFDSLKNNAMAGLSMERLWGHAAATAACAKVVARQARTDRRTEEHAYISGLLHDIGKLLIAAYRPDDFIRIREQVKNGGSSLTTAEKAVLGTTHATVGAYLLGLWGLPETIIDAVACHHDPGTLKNRRLDPTVVVHIADAFANQGPLHQTEQTDRSDPTDIPVSDRLDHLLLEHLNLTDQLAAWHHACTADLVQAAPEPEK